VASTTTSTTTIPVTITTTVPGRVLAHFTTSYTATTTVAVPYYPSYGYWVVEVGPIDHCYVTVPDTGPYVTYPGSEAYEDVVNACANGVEFSRTNQFIVVYSSTSNEWLCYWCLPFSSITIY